MACHYGTTLLLLFISLQKQRTVCPRDTNGLGIPLLAASTIIMDPDLERCCLPKNV